MTRNWYYWSGNREVGPLTLRELTHIAAQGRIVAETRLRQEKNGAWVIASSVAGLFPTSVESCSNHASRRGSPPPLPNQGHSSSIDLFPEPAIALAPGPYRNYLYAGVSVCVLLAIVAIFMTLVDDQGSQKPISPKNIQASKPVGALSGSNWIASAKDKATRSVVLIKTGNAFGTGFVAASRGGRNLIATNKHVLAGHDWSAVDSKSYPKTCSVVSEPGRRMTGRLVALATDDELDLALILVQSSELEALGRFANMDSVSVGDQVVAIGNPVDPVFANTVTNGIISGKHDPFLQTNAAINGGNSGGPLINERGEIVGINDWKIASQFVEGMNFAIRADFIPRKQTWSFFQDVSDLIADIPR